MAWVSSYILPSGTTHWFYNPTVNGLQRNTAINPASNGYLYYYTGGYYFKNSKTYQYELQVEGNFTDIGIGSVGLSASFPWTSGIYSDARIDRIIDVNASTGARYYFYSSPSANISSSNAISIYGTGSISGNNISTSPRITNLKITEIDWLISGYKRFNPGTNSTVSDINYDGWSYDKDIDTFWWTNKPNSIMGATGLSVNGDLTTNYIAQTVPYNYYNLTFQYQTFTGIFGVGGEVDGITIQTANSLNGLRTTLYSLTQSTTGNTAIVHQIYGLAGNGNYLFFVGSTTSNTSGFQAAITNLVIDGGYHPNNNQQFLFTETNIYSDPTILQILGTATSGMTFSFIVGSGSTIGMTPSNLNLIDAKFGNGTFRAGVWENGVWNSGWRVDEEVFTFDNVGVAFRTISDKRWRIQLSGPTSSASQFSIGDRISISNIVAIDINETRKLLKGYFTIINKSDTSLIVETDVSFPFRRIERDSPNHKIKVTKNVWLNGAFLNGYYTGIWNYGLFKGFPRITEMFNTHWIDGIFDGGHFNSSYDTFRFVDTLFIPLSDFGLTSTYNGNLGLSFSTPHGYVVGDKITIQKDNISINPQYDTIATILVVPDNNLVVTDIEFGNNSTLEGGTSSNVKANAVIQNFTFTDNNIASKVSSQSPGSSEPVFQFNSWIDVNFDNTSAVNIGKPVTLFDTISRLEYTQNNLYGYPTNDVLSSLSTFRDSYTLNKKSYKLGTKYKIYQDQIGSSSKFEKPFDMSIIGLDPFFSDGWTFSGTYSFYERSFEDQNYNANAPEAYVIKGEELVITSTMSGSVLNNTNINIPKNRYTIAELDIKSFSSATNSAYYQASSYVDSNGTNTYPISSIYPIPSLNFNNINQFKITFNLGAFGGNILFYIPMNYLPIYDNVNHLLTKNLTKIEYFYNKPNLSMSLLGTDDLGSSFEDYSDNNTYNGYYQSKVIIDNLKYYEVDMIPFFQYFTTHNIYKGVSIPWQGIAPFIDYTNSNFSFIDNIRIGLDSVKTLQSFAPISGVGVGISGIQNNPTFTESESK